MQEQANSGSENAPGKETTASPTTSEQPDHDQEQDLLDADADADGRDGHDG